MTRAGLASTVAAAILAGGFLTGCDGGWTEKPTPPPTPAVDQTTDAATPDGGSVPASLVGDWAREGTSGMNVRSFEPDGTWTWTVPTPSGGVHQCSGPFTVSGDQIALRVAAGGCVSVSKTWSLQRDVLILDGLRYDRQ